MPPVYKLPVLHHLPTKPYISFDIINLLLARDFIIVYVIRVVGIMSQSWWWSSYICECEWSQQGWLGPPLSSEHTHIGCLILKIVTSNNGCVSENRELLQLLPCVYVCKCIQCCTMLISKLNPAHVLRWNGIEGKLSNPTCWDVWFRSNGPPRLLQRISLLKSWSQ